MAKAFKMDRYGGSSSGGIDLTVYCQPNEPAEKVANSTVWVRSAVEMTGLVVSHDRPKEPKEGTVYIKSDVAEQLPVINLSGADNIKLDIGAARCAVYTGGAWTFPLCSYWTGRNWLKFSDKPYNIYTLFTIDGADPRQIRVYNEDFQETAGNDVPAGATPLAVRKIKGENTVIAGYNRNQMQDIISIDSTTGEIKNTHSYSYTFYLGRKSWFSDDGLRTIVAGRRSSGDDYTTLQYEKRGTISSNFNEVYSWAIQSDYDVSFLGADRYEHVYLGTFGSALYYMNEDGKHQLSATTDSTDYGSGFAVSPESTFYVVSSVGRLLVKCKIFGRDNIQTVAEGTQIAEKVDKVLGIGRDNSIYVHTATHEANVISILSEAGEETGTITIPSTHTYMPKIIESPNGDLFYIAVKDALYPNQKFADMFVLKNGVFEDTRINTMVDSRPDIYGYANYIQIGDFADDPTMII